MAVPDQQFQTIIEQIEESVKEAITKALGNQPSSPKTSSTTLDPNALREEIMDDLKTELLTFKQEFLQIIAATQTPIQSAQTTPLQRSPTIEELLAEDRYWVMRLKFNKQYQKQVAANPFLIPEMCPEPYPAEGLINVLERMGWRETWEKFYNRDGTRKKHIWV